MASELETAAKPGRRQAHKNRTQRALQQAALELFAKNGYDTTTTDEIAERAGVSPRTFFRYFPTKESVLFAGEYGWFQSFTNRYLEQPPKLTDVEALRETLVDLAPELGQIRKSLVLYERAVESSPTLRGGVYDHQKEDVATLAKAIARRRGFDEPDESASLLAAVGLVTYRRSLTRWLAGPVSVDPGSVIIEQFDLLGDLFTLNSLNGRRKPRRSAAKS